MTRNNIMTNQVADTAPPPKVKDLSSEMPDFVDGDPTDPNSVHYAVLKKLEQLYSQLPEGWTRNHDLSKSKAPFLHEDGRESFRHPSRAAIQLATEQFQAQAMAKLLATNKNQTIDKFRATANRGMIKKLRMMVQMGIPLEYVEQRAKVEGMDLSVVLGDNKQQAEEEGTEPQSVIPTPLIKKYKRMIKSGVPLKGVQSQAFVDGRWTPEQVVAALGDALDPKADMHKDQYQPRRPKLPRRQPEELSSEAAATVTAEHFQCAPGDMISFPGDSLLSALVRKMVQTVQKRVATNKDAIMLVDSLTLYHALGALQGVQMARDRYNSTCAKDMKLQEIKAKRQGFREIAKTIGMELPKELDAKVDIAGLDELILRIQNDYAKELTALNELVDEGWYDFDSLALLYTPGSKVVAKNAGGGGVDMICQVTWNRYEQGRTIMGQPTKYFKVCFQYIVAVSASYATMVEVVEGMESFEGRRSIQSSLTFVPMAAYTPDEQEDLLLLYRRRGEIYNQVTLRGKHTYMAYDKGCFFLKRTGSQVEGGGSTAAALATGGRIIVDTQGAYDNGHSLGVGYDPMVTGIKYKYKEYSLHMRSTKHKADVSGSKAAKPNAGDEGLILFDQVPYDFLDMVWPCVVGFSLTAKGWGDVLIDGLEQVEWQEDIFERLVLPENRKMMVKALVRHSTDSFQDLVQGKGEGTLFLLYGRPGTGKTLTAEAVAELLHKPLYSLSLGTLGTTAGELERRLGEIMNLCARWDAVILLDEADSFLETRSSKSSLERNAMVSVMLKLVEYFSGILFLTSNRIDSLDPAFQTRITLALRYEQLDKDARTQVWKNLLTKSGFEHTLEDGSIDPTKLAVAPLNGREIKNALRLAMAMASEKDEFLTQAILLETVDIVNDYKVTLANPYAEDKDGEGNIRCGWFFSFWKK